jgi:hypothetical protein
MSLPLGPFGLVSATLSLGLLRPSGMAMWWRPSSGPTDDGRLRLARYLATLSVKGR